MLFQSNKRLKYIANKETQTSEELEHKEDTQEKRSNWKFWKRKKTKENRQRESLIPQTPKDDDKAVAKHEHHMEEETVTTVTACQRNRNELDPSNIYANLEDAMKLAQLEEPGTLTTALRHLVRFLHKKGDSITFTQIDMVDKIILKTKNLPTDTNKLFQLVSRVFTRRGESLDVQEIYEQFVRAHGRIAFDPSQKWPLCYIHSFHP